MLDSEVSPTAGSNDEPRATGKNKNAKHMFPSNPSLNAAESSLACHLKMLIKTNEADTRILDIGLLI